MLQCYSTYLYVLYLQTTLTNHGNRNLTLLWPRRSPQSRPEPQRRYKILRYYRICAVKEFSKSLSRSHPKLDTAAGSQRALVGISLLELARVGHDDIAQSTPPAVDVSRPTPPGLPSEAFFSWGIPRGWVTKGAPSDGQPFMDLDLLVRLPTTPAHSPESSTYLPYHTYR